MRQKQILCVIALSLSCCRASQEAMSQAMSGPGGPAGPMRPAAPGNLTKVTDQTVDGLVEKYLAALGGKEKLASLRSLKMTGKLIRQGGIPPTPLTIEKKRPHEVLRRLEE